MMYLSIVLTMTSKTELVKEMVIMYYHIIILSHHITASYHHIASYHISSYQISSNHITSYHIISPCIIIQSSRIIICEVILILLLTYGDIDLYFYHLSSIISLATQSSSSLKSKSPEIIILEDSDNDDASDDDQDDDDDDDDDDHIIVTTPYGGSRLGHDGDGSGSKVSQWWKQRFPKEFQRDEEIKFHLSL